MRKLVSTKGLSKEEWLSYRRLGIGGSDSSVILGINPYRSILRLWEEKTGRLEIDGFETQYQYFGHIMEDLVKKEFERNTGLKVRRSNFILQREAHSFMIANLDGIVKDEEGRRCVFEAKTASEFKKKEWEKGVPEEYMAQLQHYLAVTGFQKAYIAAIVGGNSFFHHVVERDDDYINDLIEKESAFWACVLDGIPPLPDGSEATSKLLSEKYRDSIPDEVELPEEAETLLARYDKVVSVSDEAQKEKEKIVNHLKEMLGRHEKGYAGSRIVSWKRVQKSILDTKKLKVELGEEYEKYLTDSSYRRFMIA